MKKESGYPKNFLYGTSLFNRHNGKLFFRSYLILSKIESMKRCVDRIRAKTPLSKDILFEDWDIQDIIVVNMERTVQLSVDIASFILSESEMQTSMPMTMAESFRYLHQAGIIQKQTAEKLQKSV
jgi:uncharacterized protein YutE (UPF0331/DUF86 family)